ncbi:MAG: hypothetical protein NVSMB12_07790 [Acidimicrobiales bacterium]
MSVPRMPLSTAADTVMVPLRGATVDIAEQDGATFGREQVTKSLWLPAWYGARSPEVTDAPAAGATPTATTKTAVAPIRRIRCAMATSFRESGEAGPPRPPRHPACA